MMIDWRKLLREPLMHFLIAGFAVFVFNSWRGDGDDVTDRSITVDEAQVQQLADRWQMAWQRPPTPQELDGLIRDDIKEEIYYREALRLGLDSEDPVIRRRLRSKMEFLATSEVESADPDQAELTRYFERNKARYAADPVYSFGQIYFGDDYDTAKANLAKAKAGFSGLGKSISLPEAMEKADRTAIARAFGESFADSLRTLPINEVSGPVESGFGWHLVKIRKADASRLPKLSEVRQAVINDWRAETRTKREGAAYQTLLDGYTIKIAKP